MTAATQRIIDANINRAIEALRVIEEYTRFISLSPDTTEILKKQRHQLAKHFSLNEKKLQFSCRNTQMDLRAQESNPNRSDLSDLLAANFSRLKEALRVLEEYSGNKLFNRFRYETYDLEKKVMLPLLKYSVRQGVYLISDDPKILKKGLEWGVALIQLRNKTQSKEQILNQAIALAPIAKQHGIPFIVNDFLDIALIADADGLHIGQDDLEADQLRPLLGANKIIGKTTHSLDQGLVAQAKGADYVSVGPLWETPSKPNREGIGFDYLKAASEKLQIPYVAIGGIDLERAKNIIEYQPPLIGLIRDHDNVPQLQALMREYLG